MANPYRTVADFTNDSSFVNWITQPTPEATRYWQHWQNAHPDRRAVLEEARRQVLVQHVGTVALKPSVSTEDVAARPRVKPVPWPQYRTWVGGMLLVATLLLLIAVWILR